MEASKRQRSGEPAATSLPLRGDRIERHDPTMGIHARGTVYYVDDLQILVKWDDGRSESLRPGGQNYRVIASG